MTTINEAFEAWYWELDPDERPDYDDALMAAEWATERAAKLVDEIQDAPEEKRALKAFQDASGKGVSEELARGNHWSTVSTFNAGLKRAAAAIRAGGEKT